MMYQAHYIPHPGSFLMQVSTGGSTGGEGMETEVRRIRKLIFSDGMIYLQAVEIAAQSGHASYGKWKSVAMSTDLAYCATTEDLKRKQDKLTFDDKPTSGSANPVTSGGVKAAIEAAVMGNVDLSDYMTKDEYGGFLVPTGAMLIWPSFMAVPDTYLVCDGHAVNKADYPDLYQALSQEGEVPYGEDSAKGTFNLPTFQQLNDDAGIPMEFIIKT